MGTTQSIDQGRETAEGGSGKSPPMVELKLDRELAGAEFPGWPLRDLAQIELLFCMRPQPGLNINTPEFFAKTEERV